MGVNLFERLVIFLEEYEWEFRIEEEDVISSKIRCENSVLDGLFLVHNNTITVNFKPMSFVCPADKIEKVCEFFHRVNYGLEFGHFTIDLDSYGSVILFTNSMRWYESDMSKETMEYLLYGSASVMDSYLPDIYSMLYGGKSPAEALEEHWITARKNWTQE